MDNMQSNINSDKEVADMIFSTITDEQFEKVDELCGDNFVVMYNCWMEEEGLEFANKWVQENGNHLVGYNDIAKVTQAMMDSFISYLES